MSTLKLVSSKTIIIFCVFIVLSLMGYYNLQSAVINTKFIRLPSHQLNWIIISIGVAIVCLLFLERYSVSGLLIPGYITLLILLFLLLLFGESWGGSRRWFSTPFGGIQPSEFTKPFMIVLFSYMYANSDNCALISAVNFVLLVPVLVLIGLEPDFGTAIVFLFMYFIYYLLAENKKSRLLFFLTVLIVIALLVYAFALKPYQKDRITAFFEPDKNPDIYYQTQQSITMLASGGLYGKGYQRGLGNLYGYIPADHTDFVLAVYAEENGFIGMLVFYSLWFLMFTQIISIINHKKGKKRWLAIGCFSVLFFQFSINVSMVIGLVPVTGLPLPFFTYGGSSSTANSLIIGILLWCSLTDKKTREVFANK